MPKSILDRIKKNRKKHPNSFKRVSTIDSWLNGDGHTKRRESPTRTLTPFAQAIIDRDKKKGSG